MNFRKWSRSNREYGRQLLHSGIEGALSGREEFLNGDSMDHFLAETGRGALTAAVLGACIGVVGGCSGSPRKSGIRRLALGLLGGAIGLGAGLAWESRRLTAKAAASAMKNMGQVRDRHWLDKHPIDYA